MSDKDDLARQAMNAAYSDMERAAAERRRSYKEHLRAALDDYRWLYENGMVTRDWRARMRLRNFEKMAGDQSSSP